MDGPPIPFSHYPGRRHESQVLLEPMVFRLQFLFSMTTKTLTLPEIGLIAGTRVALGTGIGLLISEKLNRDQRKGAGWVLLGMGILTTIPLLVGILRRGPGADRPVALAA
jgi:hypothetical protein